MPNLRPGSPRVIPAQTVNPDFRRESKLTVIRRVVA